MEIELVSDFRERKVGDLWIENFDSFYKRQWDDFDYKLPAGESLREVQERNIRALNRIVERYLDGNIVIGTHGTALSTIIRYFDSSFGYNEFNQIKNLMPWIVMISFDHNACTEIKKYNLFERYKIK